MSQFINEFLSLWSVKPLIWFRYVDDFFFVRTHAERKLYKFIKDSNNHQPNIKITYNFSKIFFSFPDLDAHLSEGKQKVTYKVNR